MTSILVIVVFIGISAVHGQWGGGGVRRGFGWGSGGGGFGWGSGRGGFPQQQTNANQANKVNCKSQYENNILEVTIRPQQTFFFAGGSAYTIEVSIKSFDIEGRYTIAITDLSSDNPLCLESDLGFIATNGQSPNNGLLSLLSGQIAQPQSAGVVGDINVVLGDETIETFTYNSLFRDFREFRGLGVGICTDVTDNGGQSAAQFNPFFPQRRNTRQLCEYPVFCCKLGLSNTNV